MRLAQPIIVITCALYIWGPTSSIAQTTLVLRDLSVVETQKLTFDRDQVTTAEGQTFGWDQVIKASLVGDQGLQFERKVKEIGTPLFRVRHRLLVRDFGSLTEIVETQYRDIQNEPLSKTNCRKHYLINLATFRSRLANGKRVEALIPFLELCEIHRQFPNTGKHFESSDVPTDDLAEKFSRLLVPIWFDKRQAEFVLQQIGSHSQSVGASASSGVAIYLTSLRIAAGKLDQASQEMVRISGNKTQEMDRWNRWEITLNVQLELARGENGPASKELIANYREFKGPRRGVANFLVGKLMARNANDYDHAVLELLYIPANYQNSLPSLSSAALFEAAAISELAGRHDEAKIMRKQLSEQYQNTYHVDLMQTQR